MKRILMPCLVGAALVVAVLLAAGVEAETVFVAVAALACPLMMLLMMGGMFKGASRLVRERDGEGQASSSRQG